MLPLGVGRPRPSGWLALKSRVARKGGGHGGVPWTDPRWVNHHVMGTYHDVTGLMNIMEYSWDIRDLR